MTLTAEEKQVITATVPILEAGGETLTKHFYARMMSHNPEVKKFFNQTHQKDGTQARALANAVLLYAKNIDRLEALGAVAPAIIEKHVALDIKPEHYPIVGTNLIASMKEVLGPETATPAVIDAWTKAYFQLADILIGAEGKEYERLKAAPGGWADFRTFVVKKKVEETKDIVSVWLEPEDGKPVLAAKPGQYITLKATIDGQECRRNYSVSNAPSTTVYRITVKKIGVVSGYIHSLKIGDKLELRPPVGNFTVDLNESEEPIVMIAGGVGITPLAAMALSGQKGKLLYYAHSEEDRALAKELGELKTLEIIPVDRRPTAEVIDKHVSSTSHIYYTGPTGFMATLQDIFKKQGVPKINTHFEFFGSGQ